MTDPRFDGTHLNSPRREEYAFARGTLFGSCGPLTRDLEFRPLRPHPRPVPCPEPPPDVPFALFDARRGVYIPLRIGLTAIGRAAENDLVLPDNPISRRHCVVLVHTAGGCEIHDTASRNGTRVNDRRIERVWLNHGDVIQLCDWVFRFSVRNADTRRGDVTELEEADVPLIVTTGESPTGDWGLARPR